MTHVGFNRSGQFSHIQHTQFSQWLWWPVKLASKPVNQIQGRHICCSFVHILLLWLSHRPRVLLKGRSKGTLCFAGERCLLHSLSQHSFSVSCSDMPVLRFLSFIMRLLLKQIVPPLHWWLCDVEGWPQALTAEACWLNANSGVDRCLTALRETHRMLQRHKQYFFDPSESASVLLSSQRVSRWSVVHVPHDKSHLKRTFSVVTSPALILFQREPRTC